jgi:acetyltransferase-like isoleucine patch superfamily enzyme
VDLNKFHSLRDRLLFRLRHRSLWSHFYISWLRLCGVKVGKNTIIPRVSITWPHQLQIGSNCTLEPDIFFKFDGIWRPGPSIIIGNNVFIGRGCEFNIIKGIMVGQGCAIASGCKFIDHDHGITGQQIDETRGAEGEIEIGDFVWLGCNVVVLRGVSIGSSAVVGAGAVVTKSIPAGEIWAGMPAQKVSSRAERHVRKSLPACAKGQLIH